MKESTKKRNTKLIKSAMDEIDSPKNASKAERNKFILNEIQSPKSEEEVIEEKDTKSTTSRSFRCPTCGYEVILSGTVALDKSITKCSKCLAK